MRRQNKLSNRELEYLKLGLLPKEEIAKRLFVTKATVNTQTANIRKFYKVYTTAAAVFSAIRDGDIEFIDVSIPGGR